MARNHIPSMLTTEGVMAKVIQHKGRTVRATLALDHQDTQPPLQCHLKLCRLLMEVESRGGSDGQPGRGVGGRDGQMTSPVSQSCTVKKVTELSVFNLGR